MVVGHVRGPLRRPRASVVVQVWGGAPPPAVLGPRVGGAQSPSTPLYPRRSVSGAPEYHVSKLPNILPASVAFSGAPRPEGPEHFNPLLGYVVQVAPLLSAPPERATSARVTRLLLLRALAILLCSVSATFSKPVSSGAGVCLAVHPAHRSNTDGQCTVSFF